MFRQVLFYNTILLYSFALLYVEAQQTTLDPRSLLFSTTSVAKGPTTPDNTPFIETDLVGPFKVWHVAGFAFTGLTTIVIGICCMIDLRVPRTKEEIEQNYEKRQAAHKYVDKLGKLDFHGVQTKSQAVLQKENELKKKNKSEKSKEKKEKKDEKKEKSGKNTPMPGRAAMGYHPGSMMGMMGGFPGMAMAGQGGTQTPGGGSLAEGMSGGMGMMNPAMMNPMMMNMWRSQSMGNLQQMMGSPMMQRANSVTSLQGAQQTPKMKRLVQKLQEAKARGELDEGDGEKEDKKEGEEKKEESKETGNKFANKKKKWGKK